MGLFKTYSEKEVKRVMPIVNKINALEEETSKLSDEELRAKTHCIESTDEKLNLRHGLGVLLVWQIVEAHRGTMEILSERHSGYKTELIFPN